MNEDTINDNLVNETLVNETLVNETLVNEECSICLSKIDENSYLTNCNHSFCQSCLEDWFRANHISCPLCRCEITECNHNKDNTKIKIYVTNDTNVTNDTIDNSQMILNLRSGNQALRNILRRYNFTFGLVFSLYIWDKWGYYNILQNYNIANGQRSELQAELELLNTSYMNCMDREQCVYNIQDMKETVAISLYEYHNLLGICSVPVNYLYSCILNN
jgi:hypothetical protein